MQPTTLWPTAAVCLCGSLRLLRVLFGSRLVLPQSPPRTRKENAKESTFSLWYPLFCGHPLLRIEKTIIKINVGAHLGIRLGGCRFAVNHKDDFRRDPTAAKPLVLIKLRFRCQQPIFTGRPEHANKI